MESVRFQMQWTGSEGHRCCYTSQSGTVFSNPKQRRRVWKPPVQVLPHRSVSALPRHHLSLPMPNICHGHCTPHSAILW